MLESVRDELRVVRPRSSTSGRVCESLDENRSSTFAPICPLVSLNPSLALMFSFSGPEGRDDVGEGNRLDGAVGGDGA